MRLAFARNRLLANRLTARRSPKARPALNFLVWQNHAGKGEPVAMYFWPCAIGQIHRPNPYFHSRELVQIQVLACLTPSGLF